VPAALLHEIVVLGAKLNNSRMKYTQHNIISRHILSDLIEVGSIKDVFNMLCYDVRFCSVHTVYVDLLNFHLQVTVIIYTVTQKKQTTYHSHTRRTKLRSALQVPVQDAAKISYSQQGNRR